MDGSQTSRKDADVSDRSSESEKPDDAKSPPPKKMSTGKKVLLIGLAIIVVLAIAIGGTLYWLDARHFESTDDAFVDGHISLMATQVSGRVLRLAVRDNELVAPDQLLLLIDPRDLQIKLDQALAQQAQAEAQVEQAKSQAALQSATIEQSNAQLRVSQAELSQAQQDLARYRSIDPKAITRQLLDNAGSSSRASQAKVDASRYAVAAAQAQLAAAQAQIGNAEAAAKGSDVAVRNARLQLSYTELRAPQAGRVTKRTVEVGNVVNPGQALLDIVATGMWVTANFKETQLALMKIGQPVDVRVDAIPDHVFHGRIDSMQAGSGSIFSTLPAENATGNYVKVVQRVPVKIVLDEADDSRLAPGMSANPKVTVR